MIRPTKTGLVFLCICGLLYLAANTSQSSLLLVFVGIILGCFAVNFVLARNTVNRVEVCPPGSTLIGEGEKATHPWRVSNAGKGAAGFVQIRMGGQTVLAVGGLAPKETLSALPEMVFTRRGVYQYAAMTLSSAYPFGLVRLARPLQLAGEVVVHPLIYPAIRPRAAGYDVMVGGKFRGKRRTSSGTHFAGIRPIQPGDGLKQIHWKSSAKGQGIMVKTFDEELSGRVAVIMDAGHAGNAVMLDDCARATASLIFAALDAGHHAEWVDLAAPEPLLIPPFADGRELLVRLAQIKASPGCLALENLRRAVERVSRKSAILLVLTEFNEAAAAVIVELQKHHRGVSVCLPEGAQAQPVGVPVLRYSASSIAEAA